MEEKPKVFNLDSSNFAKKSTVEVLRIQYPYRFFRLRLKTAAHKFVLGK